MRVIDRAMGLVRGGPVKGAALVLLLGSLLAGAALGTAEGQLPRQTGRAKAAEASLTGKVVSDAKPLRRIQVSLYRAGTGSRSAPLLLGASRTRSDGSFSIAYPARRSAGVLYAVAGRAPAVRLASVLGAGSIPRHVIVNERTTVAAGFALAEFVGARGISGKTPGPQNGAGIAADLVDPRTGGLSAVLRTPPNGSQTSTLAEFNTLANLLVPCARSGARCGALFGLARPAGGARPQGVLAAVADIARNPAHNAAQLFALASSGRAPYQPALTASQRPDARVDDGTALRRERKEHERSGQHGGRRPRQRLGDGQLHVQPEPAGAGVRRKDPVEVHTDRAVRGRLAIRRRRA